MPIWGKIPPVTKVPHKGYGVHWGTQQDQAEATKRAAD